MKILITGCAGFIGFHLTKKLMNDKKLEIFGIDTIDPYYDVKLKYKRLNILKKNLNFNFFKLDISNKNKLLTNFKKNKYDIVINLAAQAGVRFSITNPENYLKSNVIGFFNILECSKIFKIKKLIYASSSSVYGDNKDFPLKESASTDSPLSFYAATKKTNEVFAHAYSNTYNLQTIGLRFFTVYGPYGRPDMSLFKFVDNIYNNKKIDLFNNGKHVRDFTYVEDVVDAISKLIYKKLNFKKIPYIVFNIASSAPKTLAYYLNVIEGQLNKKAIKNYKNLQLGDVKKTHGDVTRLKKYINFNIKMSLYEGIVKYIKWYKEFYK